MKLILFLSLLLGISYWKKVVSFFKREDKVPTPIVEKKVIFPDNYTAEEVKVVKYNNYDFEGEDMGEKEIIGYNIYPRKKVIIFSDRGMESITDGTPNWHKWRSIRKEFVCSHIQKTDADGTIVKSYYLPSSTSGLYYNPKTGKVEC